MAVPSRSSRVLVVEDAGCERPIPVSGLLHRGHSAAVASSPEAALAHLAQDRAEVVVIDARLAGGRGLELLDRLAELPAAPAVIMTQVAPPAELVIEALRHGADDFLTRPFDLDELEGAIRRAVRKDAPRRDPAARRERDSKVLIGRSPRMAEVLRMVAKIADYKTTVLISGESGTGKELVARALHDLGARRHGPFVALNCGAIPEALLESELFGHRRGAFTDAIRDKKGLFEEASGGTLFLDELGELPLGLQVKLLRVLQEEELRRLGDTQNIKVDVRVVAATVRDLAQEVEAGNFREDLFYRLNVLPLTLPPLRDRPEDIPALALHFLQRNNQRFGLRITGIATPAMRRLVSYAWPGNVRELENTVEHAMVLSESSELLLENLPEKVRSARPETRSLVPPGELSIKKTTRALEEELIRRALQQTGGNRTSAARILEISHRALLYKIKEYGIDA
jgi:two-component system response regulator AtoC